MKADDKKTYVLADCCGCLSGGRVLSMGIEQDAAGPAAACIAEPVKRHRFPGGLQRCCWRYTDRTASVPDLTKMSAGGLCSRTHFGKQSFNAAANLGGLGADASD